MRRAVFIMAWCAMCGAAYSQNVSDSRLRVRPSASRLANPTAFAFLGAANSDYFIAEKDTGLIKRISPSGTATVLDIPVDNAGHHGLIGLAVDPSFATNGFAYVHYSRSKAGGDSSDPSQWLENRVSRFHWNGLQLTDEQVLLTVPGAPLAGEDHNGGPLRFGPDGMLYGNIGEMSRSGAEQNNQATANTSSSAGGIFRISTNPAQPIPSSNPFVGIADPAFSRWYAYGVRNSFGLAFDPATAFLWDTENGQNDYDEINRVQPGFNSGWSKVQGPLSRNVNTTADLVNLPGSHYSDPEFSWKEQLGVTSSVFLKGSQFGPEYDNGMLVGDTNTGNLSLLRLNQNRTGFTFSDSRLNDLVADGASEASTLVFGSDFSVPTDMQLGPDGALYLLSYAVGTLYRIELAPDPTKPWQNSARAEDVNRDGQVIPQDVLILVNELNANGIHQLGAPPVEGTSLYFDVDSNNSIEPLDVIRVVNLLNSPSSSVLNTGPNPAAVPEPTTLVTALAGVASWMASRICSCRKRRPRYFTLWR